MLQHSQGSCMPVVPSHYVSLGITSMPLIPKRQTARELARVVSCLMLFQIVPGISVAVAAGNRCLLNTGRIWACHADRQTGGDRGRNRDPDADAHTHTHRDAGIHTQKTCM